MSGYKTKLPGFTIDKKTGKPIRNKKSLPAHLRIASKSKKRVVTRAQAIGIKKK